MAQSDPMLKLCGALVRHWREAAGVTRQSLAEGTNYGPDTVASVELGRRSPSPQFLDVAERMLSAQGTIELMKDHLHTRPRALVEGELSDMEQRSIDLRYYAPCTVPALLRTDDYARAMRLGRPPQSGTGVAVGVRDRQGVLESAVPVALVIDQSVLKRPIGGRRVLRDQLLHLAGFARRPNVSLQVMPLDSVEHAGIASPMALLTLDGKTLGCVDSGADVQWVSPTAVEHLEWRYSQLRAQAFSPYASLALIERAVAELEA